MALPKGTLSIEERDGLGFKTLVLKDVYFQSIDAAGIMLNTQSDGKGRIRFYPMARVLSTDMDPPPAAPAIAMPTRTGPMVVGPGGRRSGLDG